jgi:hypothetical protein
LHAGGGRVSSAAMMNILSSCPHLIHVSRAGPLDAREILGLKRDAPEMEDYVIVIMSKRKSTGNGEPLPMMIYPPEWACRNLQLWRSAFVG